MEQSLDKKVIDLDINESRQIFDSLSEEKKKELTDLLHYPTLITTLAKQLSGIIKTVVTSIPPSSELDNTITQKILASYETLDNAIFINEAIIKNESDKFLTESKDSKKEQNME